MRMDLKEIDVLILTGGKGSRLRSVVNDRPKTMVEINGVPFLEILLESLYKQGFDRFILCTGYMGTYIENYFFSTTTNYSISISHEKSPLDTGGAIKNAEDLISSDPFIVLNGDSYCKISYQHILSHHKTNNSFVTIVVSKTENSREYGEVVIDKAGRIIKFKEKSQSQGEVYVSVGIYLINRSVLDMLPANVPFSMEKAFFPSLNKNRFFAYRTENPFIDLGTPERYEAIKKQLGKQYGE